MSKPKNSTAAVVLPLPNNEYKRFVGHNMTHHVKSDRPLTPQEVELLRTNPAALMS